MEILEKGKVRVELLEYPNILSLALMVKDRIMKTYDLKNKYNRIVYFDISVIDENLTLVDCCFTTEDILGYVNLYPTGEIKVETSPLSSGISCPIVEVKPPKYIMDVLEDRVKNIVQGVNDGGK